MSAVRARPAIEPCFIVSQRCFNDILMGDFAFGNNAHFRITRRLVAKRQLDSSISHYIEAGATVKALEAAVNARQFKKALQV